MKKTAFLVVLFVLAAYCGYSQTIPLVTVHDLQTYPGQDLVNCNDRPNPLYCDTLGVIVPNKVRVRGIVIVPGGIAQTASVGNRQIWIRDISDSGAFTTIDVRPSTANPTSPSDILDMQAGDTVEIIGSMEEYLGSQPANGESESQIVPDNDGVSIIGRSTGPAPKAKLLTVCTFNDQAGNNVLPTGEAFEGAFVEFHNVTVTGITQFTTGTDNRYRFDISDGQGCIMQVNDRFAAMRTRNGWIPPVVGDRYNSLKGIIIHQKNNCPVTSTFNRGYTLAPFDASHFVIGVSAPSIGSIHHSPYSPTPAQACTVTARVISATNTIKNVFLKYTLNTSIVYDSVPMTPVATGSSIYSAQIAPKPDNSFVKFYITANDNNNQTSSIPNVSNTSPVNPLAYFVHTDGSHISDIQLPADGSGKSYFVNDTVTLQGYVTSVVDSSNLGTVFIQQDPAASVRNGIWLQPGGDPTVETFTLGQRVRVTGIVSEWRNVMTSLVNTTNASVVSAMPTPVTPLVVNPDSFSTYDVNVNEKYEGVLVTAQYPSGNLYVSDTNIVIPGLGGITPGTNFGEWRLGADWTNKNRGIPVLTGDIATTSFASAAVSYVNNHRWFTNGRSLWSGLNPAPLVITPNTRFTRVTGPVFHSFSTIKILPRNNSDLPGFVLSNAPEISSAYKLYPNPSNGVLQVSALNKGAAHTVTVSSLTGAPVASASFSGLQTTMDLSGLSNGVYLVSIASEKGTYHSRIVLNR